MDMRTDLYPSRAQPSPGFLDRQDPVLYGVPGQRAALSAEQCESYARDGFLILSDLFAEAELGAFRAELERLRRSDEIRNGETVITEPGSGEVRSIFKVHRLSPVFASLAADRRLVGLAEFILGDHSDFETWHVEDGMPRMRALSMSISLTDNNPLNGPLLLVPGSHRHYVACVGETPEEHYKESLKKQEYGVPDDDSLRRLVDAGGIVAVTGGVGSVAIFDCNTMHGSNGNITPYDRANVFLVYNAVCNRLVEPFGAPSPRPHFIAEREDVAPL
jgi:ectoine hydroxylase